MKIPFHSQVYQNHIPREPSWSQQEMIKLKKQIKILLNKGVIEKCYSVKNEYISKIFLVDKPDGSSRLILNLKKLNNFVETYHFKLEDVRTAQKLMLPRCYMATLDLKDAYYLIPIAKEDRKYLRFYFQSELFEFTTLPFGLSCAPYIYTKLMKPIVAFLRKLGFLSVIYLDDLLLMGKNYSDCMENINFTITTLNKLGFVVNYKKSNIFPSMNCTFLGLCLDSEKMTIELPKDKRNSTLKLINKYSKLKKCKIRDFASFIGTLGFCCQAAKYGWAYVKNFERLKIKALANHNNSFEAVLELDLDLEEDFEWWRSNILKIYKPIQILKFSLEIFTDSSKTGWGVCCKNERIHGFWSTKERTYHINLLEILAAFFGLKSFVKDMKNCNILLRCDNTTAITYINKMGGTLSKDLNIASKQIWKWCESRNIFIFASYIRSKDNVIADFESRRLEPETEYELSDVAFKEICKVFGNPEVDLFASRANAKCQKYVSWKKDPGSMDIDAFTIEWKPYFFYAFPPFALILKILRKIEQEGARGSLVVPNWPSQPWYPLYMSMLVSKPIEFNPNINLLYSSNREPHPLWNQLSLVAGISSGKCSN